MPEYTHGHQESALKSHRWRNAKNSAAFLLPHLKEDYTILDVGSGPGTITIDLAKNYVPKGKVLGVENVDNPLMASRASAIEQGVENVEFQVADVHKLPFADDTFDVAFAHQVLQHLPDPVKALQEMRRVVKPGGIVAVRDNYMAGTVIYPWNDSVNEFHTHLYPKVSEANGGQPDVGPRYKQIARLAGYPLENSTFSSSNWAYASNTEAQWWSSLWAERLKQTNLGESAIRHGIVDEAKINQMSEQWVEWGKSPDAWCNLVHFELIHKK